MSRSLGSKGSSEYTLPTSRRKCTTCPRYLYCCPRTYTLSATKPVLIFATYRKHVDADMHPRDEHLL